MWWFRYSQKEGHHQSLRSTATASASIYLSCWNSSQSFAFSLTLNPAQIQWTVVPPSTFRLFYMNSSIYGPYLPPPSLSSLLTIFSHSRTRIISRNSKEGEMLLPGEWAGLHNSSLKWKWKLNNCLPSSKHSTHAKPQVSIHHYLFFWPASKKLCLIVKRKPLFFLEFSSFQ